MKTNTNVIVTRGQYGEITTPEIVAAGRAVLAIAIKRNVLEAEYYQRRSSKNAEALNYDIYDQDGGTWLVQQRYTTISKYGASNVKNYYLLRRQGGSGIAVETVEQGKKGTANRAAKSAVKLGDAVKTLRGELKLPGVKRAPSETGTFWKSVALVDGQYRSIYDNDTVYEIGKTLVQAAKGDHGGGYYVYASEAAARACEVPTNSDNVRAPRVVLQCECSGPSVRYDNGKIAFTRIKPVAVVEI